VISPPTCARFAVLEDEVAKKNHQKMTPEENARQEETLRLARERIASREAKEREEDARSAERRG
jgi:hypothetical protein